MIQKLFWKCTLQATLAQYPHWSCISSYFLQFHAGGRLGFPAHFCSQKADLQGNNLASSPSSTSRNSFLQLTPQGLFLELLPLPLSSTCHNAPIIIPRNLCTWPSIHSQIKLLTLEHTFYSKSSESLGKSNPSQAKLLDWNRVPVLRICGPCPPSQRPTRRAWTLTPLFIE